MLFVLPVLLLHTGILSQTYILDEQFNSAPSVPATLIGTGAPFGSSSTVSNYGRTAPSFQMKANAQTLVYGPWTGNADHISFYHKGLSGAGSQVVVEESIDGVSWTVVDTADVITTSATFDADLQNNSRYVKLTLLLAATCYTYIDDLRIRAQTDMCAEPLTLLEVLINGGCASCEGANEFVYFDTGSSPLDINYFELVSQTVTVGGCSYGGNGAGDNPNTNWVLNNNYSAGELAYIANLNLWAGCAGVFVMVPPNNTIPPSARVLAFTGALPDATYNFSSICSMGTIYVIFATQTDCGGKYANASCSSNCTRYLTIFNHQFGCLDNEMYAANSVNTSAANAYIFQGANIGYTSTANCSFLLMSSKIKRFTAERRNDVVDLNWITLSEEFVVSYSIERSEDGIHFKTIGEVPSLNSSSEFTYEFSDDDVSDLTDYYRLKIISLNEAPQYSELVVVPSSSLNSDFEIYQNRNSITIEARDEDTLVEITIYNSLGQNIFGRKTILTDDNQYIIEKASIETGLHVITIQSDKRLMSKKIMIY